MAPQPYNPYSNPAKNEMLLPAGIFAVPGKSDEDLDDAFVYGYAASSTIGHEITHGFDDERRQFDDKGNLHDSCQPDDETKFKDNASRIIQKVSGFNPLNTLHQKVDA